jgi:hypothetical protein
MRTKLLDIWRCLRIVVSEIPHAKIIGVTSCNLLTRYLEKHVMAIRRSTEYRGMRIILICTCSGRSTIDGLGFSRCKQSSSTVISQGIGLGTYPATIHRIRRDRYKMIQQSDDCWPNQKPPNLPPPTKYCNLMIERDACLQDEYGKTTGWYNINVHYLQDDQVVSGIAIGANLFVV